MCGALAEQVKQTFEYKHSDRCRFRLGLLAASVSISVLVRASSPNVVVCCAGRLHHPWKFPQPLNFQSVPG